MDTELREPRGQRHPGGVSRARPGLIAEGRRASIVSDRGGSGDGGRREGRTVKDWWKQQERLVQARGADNQRRRRRATSGSDQKAGQVAFHRAAEDLWVMNTDG